MAFIYYSVTIVFDADMLYQNTACVGLLHCCPVSVISLGDKHHGIKQLQQVDPQNLCKRALKDPSDVKTVTKSADAKLKVSCKQSLFIQSSSKVEV